MFQHVCARRHKDTHLCIDEVTVKRLTKSWKLLLTVLGLKLFFPPPGPLFKRELQVSSPSHTLKNSTRNEWEEQFDPAKNCSSHACPADAIYVSRNPTPSRGEYTEANEDGLADESVGSGNVPTVDLKWPLSTLSLSLQLKQIALKLNRCWKEGLLDYPNGKKKMHEETVGKGNF